MANIFATKTQAEWTAIFNDLDACVEPVLDMDGAAAHAHSQSRRSFRVENGRATPKTAPKMVSNMAPDGRPVANRKVPATGEHTAEILRENGYSADEIERLINIGAVEQNSESKL